MERVLASELGVHVGMIVNVKGWVYRIRRLKQVCFVVLRDRSGFVQCVLTPELEATLDLTHETVVSIKGQVREGNNAFGNEEIDVISVEILNAAAPDLPVQVNNANVDVNLDTMLEHRVLALRHPKEAAIFKIQAAIAHAFAGFLSREGFTEIHSPKLVKEGAEGGSNVFKVEYFGQTAYLAQSPQFYKQMMVISGFERVFEVGPVFRAEAHSTSRHLNEYISLDFEMAFIEDEHVLMALETRLLKSIFHHLKALYTPVLSLLEVELPNVPDVIPELKLSEAIKILKEVYGKIELEGDLDPEGEKLISQYIKEKTGSDFLFLTHYSQKKRPMYTMPCGAEETRSFDLLYNGLEITTGGLRIHHYDLLMKRMMEKGLDPAQYSSYLEAFKYGAPPHGGLAIGLERLTAQLLGFSNVRRTSLFPRDGHRLTP